MAIHGLSMALRVRHLESVIIIFILPRIRQVIDIDAIAKRYSKYSIRGELLSYSNELLFKLMTILNYVQQNKEEDHSFPFHVKYMVMNDTRNK